MGRRIQRRRALVGVGGYALHPTVDNAFLVRERDRRRRRELVWILLAAVPLVIGLLTYSWVHQELIAAGYRMDQLERQLHDLEQMERRLELELARRGSPALVERRAVEELGMVPPTSDQLVFWRTLR